jgi:hypothetical protein
MSEPKADPKADAVIAAIENAPVDRDLLTPEELVEFDALVTAGDATPRTTADVLAELAERAKRAG